MYSSIWSTYDVNVVSLFYSCSQKAIRYVEIRRCSDIFGISPIVQVDTVWSWAGVGLELGSYLG
jgi:hypothetical protein